MHIGLGKYRIWAMISQPFFEIGTFVPIYVELWYLVCFYVGSKSVQKYRFGGLV